MPIVNLGRIGFVNKGAYIGSNTPYKVNDIVKYNNSVYVCIQAHATENLPTNTLYWQVWMDTTNYYVRSEVDNLLLTEIGTPIASASTTNIGGVNAGDIIHITGTTTITSLGASVTGTIRTLIFDNVLTLTHHSTSMILPGGENILTVAGTSATFVCENGALGYWKCTGLTTELATIAPLAPAVTAVVGTSTVVARQDHVHPTNFTATATDIKMNGAQAVGTLTTFPRADHVHPTDTSRAPLESPALTGTPTAPTATAGTNTTQLATTAYVLANSVTLDSPAFTGTPTAPTALVGDSSTKIATTAFVQSATTSANIQLGTSSSVGTGTFADAMGIPANVKRVTVFVNGVSTNGTSALALQVITGTSTVVSTGYEAIALSAGNATSNTTTVNTNLFPLTTALTTAGLCQGKVVLESIGGNKYIESGMIKRDVYMANSTGVVDALAVITGIRLTTEGGTNVFDAGSITLSWEF